MNWYSSVYKAIIIASSVCFIIYNFSSGQTAYGSIIAGYSTLTLGILMIMLIIFNNVLEATKDGNFYSIIYEMIMASGPFMLMLTIVGLILYLLINYKDRILDGHVSSGYNSFSNITIILLLIQIYIIYKNINTEKFETTKKLSRFTSSILYLFGTITLISSLTIFSILKYFSADGFKSSISYLS
jgi:hypothetical protein